MSFETGSSISLNAPLVARSSSSLEDDEVASTASGQSSVDLGPLQQPQSRQSSVDDSERLSMLASAVSWIKEELVSQR